MDKEKIGGLISALRKELGMTQKELADQLHVSDRTVSKWERGAGLPDPSVMIALADILGITVNELLVGERAPEGSKKSEDGEAVKEALQVLVQHVKAREKSLRKRILAGALAAAAIIGCGVLTVRKLGEDRILFPPDITCDVRQRDTDVAAVLEVDRSLTGVYDYICAYELDRYGNVFPVHRKMWQSYEEAVPEMVYEELQKVCPGKVTRITKLDTGYLVGSWQENPRTENVTETDWELKQVFQYTVENGKGISTAFVQENMLYVVSYDGGEQRTYLTSVDKITGKMETDSFTYRDFVPDAGEEASLGKILFDGANMWVKNGILYFAETYFDLERGSVLGAYDLENDRAIFFREIENSQIVMVRKEPEHNRVAVVVNPMYYQPLELHLLDDETLEPISITPLELPAEFLTRQYSDYAVQTYLLFTGDMDEERVAVLFRDEITGESLKNGIDRYSMVLAVYDRETGRSLWRGRLQLDERYEIDNITLLPE